jgi:hypothetical protein
MLLWWASYVAALAAVAPARTVTTAVILPFVQRRK